MKSTFWHRHISSFPSQTPPNLEEIDHCDSMCLSEVGETQVVVNKHGMFIVLVYWIKSWSQPNLVRGSKPHPIGPWWPAVIVEGLHALPAGHVSPQRLDAMWYHQSNSKGPVKPWGGLKHLTGDSTLVLLMFTQKKVIVSSMGLILYQVCFGSTKGLYRVRLKSVVSSEIPKVRYIEFNGIDSQRHVFRIAASAF